MGLDYQVVAIHNLESHTDKSFQRILNLAFFGYFG